jgi:hypothetical protein
MAIAGINVFTDYQTKSSHKRLSLGLEYQRANFTIPKLIVARRPLPLSPEAMPAWIKVKSYQVQSQTPKPWFGIPAC